MIWGGPYGLRNTDLEKIRICQPKNKRKHHQDNEQWNTSNNDGVGKLLQLGELVAAALIPGFVARL